MESARLNDAGVPTEVDRLTDSTISIRNLLEYVNKYFPDILPMDVLQHLGRIKRPSGIFSNSVKYSSTATLEQAQQKTYTRKESREIIDSVIGELSFGDDYVHLIGNTGI
ncbi:MAG: hypothetical protein PHW00_05815 [Clostridia bacterium]|nr:hypothetical protein [Clostridia bacterium]